jgi:hypothetical protein
MKAVRGISGKLILQMVGLLLLSGGFSCSRTPEEELSFGPTTGDLDLASYDAVYYVSPHRGSDQTGKGSRGQPWQSVNLALAQIRDASSTNRLAVLVSAGAASMDTIQMVEHVDLLGGFSGSDWRRDVRAHRTILSGEGVRRVVVGADQALLDGFVITGGRVRGKGAGLLCEGVSPLVRNNVFVDNATLGPENWNPVQLHETANDGGAVYVAQGAAPIFEHNLFVRNETEIGRGAALAFSGGCVGRVVRNVFLNNVSGTKDPMRSSDGAALSIFDRSSPLIEENLFIGNRALASNDGGGVFIALWSAPKVTRNAFLGNYGDDDGGALFVGGQEHRYDRPLDALPEVADFFVDIRENVLAGNSNRSRNSGAMRFTMEARGRFSNNVLVENTGLYFQRSEVEIAHNTIMDDFRFVETKENLGPSRISNNLIWGRLQLGIPVGLEGNNLKEAVPDGANSSRQPVFVGDSMTLSVESSTYQADRFVTRLLVADGFEGNGLAGRIVEWEGRYSTVVASERRELEVFGDFSAARSIRILGTHRLVEGSGKPLSQGASRQCRVPWAR